MQSKRCYVWTEAVSLDLNFTKSANTATTRITACHHTGLAFSRSLEVYEVPELTT